MRYDLILLKICGRGEDIHRADTTTSGLSHEAYNLVLRENMEMDHIRVHASPLHPSRRQNDTLLMDIFCVLDKEYDNGIYMQMQNVCTNNDIWGCETAARLCFRP